MIAVQAMLMRGGTSKGMYFLRSDLQETGQDLDTLLPMIMGSPDRRQIDGVGGGSTTTSKVAIVGPSTRPGCDIDYLFGQVDLDSMRVDWTPTCGNLLVGVGPYAVERGLVPAGDPLTTVRVNLVNTGARVELTVRTPGGIVTYQGDHRIAGVPRRSAPVDVAFTEFVGGTTGRLHPTGRPVDVAGGIEFTGIDAAVCAVVARAESFGLGGDENPADLDADRRLGEAIEAMRLRAALQMGMGDVRGRVLPKVMLVSRSGSSAAVRSRYFVPIGCHPAHAVSGAIALSTAAAVGNTVVDSVLGGPQRAPLLIEHPAGVMEVDVALGTQGTPMRASLQRTARKLFDGTVFVDPTAMAS
ncbi:PrpF domain-containing protein [Gordonia sp. L191]|uniref:PrpF domain-containing protein n=1 Tax=unclassified Gordonia (in: high G+C Gram-positive bacteria) TaxID=2657482 RepID=UPI0009AC8447|nr:MULTISPECIES: PrpF domain-containing protein [unclassified Gordonia (in: high G+C Gram-positive bacteria)]MDF3281368.1 PrpF domain-containing protein [Gordonia sp. N1V]OPX09998.1 hypothetical protein B1964_24180 [Gordonia sp. i37]WHU47078.1 PrpF domain-containing protein [Gordonia sp. L191]